MSEPSRSTRRRSAPLGMPPPEELLVDGGDARLAIDPATRVNKYGCRRCRDPGLAAFGSSTSSVVSALGFAAAESLRRRLLRASALGEPPPFTYRRELQRLRRELIRLCGLADFPGVEIVFAASGTDLHQIAAQLVAGERAAALRVLMTETAETGSGLPAPCPAAAPGVAGSAAPARAGDGPARRAATAAPDRDALIAAAGEGGTDAANYGLLLGWEAALAELRAVRRLAEGEVRHFVAEFATAVHRRLADDPQLEALAAPGPDRRPVVPATSWDHLPTIFPFLLRRGSATLGSAAPEQVYGRLRAFPSQPGPPAPSAPPPPPPPPP